MMPLLGGFKVKIPRPIEPTMVKNTAGVSNPFESPNESYQSRGSSACLYIGLLLVCVLAVLSVPIAFYAGTLVGSESVYEQYSKAKTRQLKRLIELEPERFSRLRALPDSRGDALMLGTVNSQDDFDLLQEKVRRAFGSLDGSNCIIHVKLLDNTGEKTEPVRAFATSEDYDIAGLGIKS